ncbi:sialate O-acetylesterase [Neobacillus vireti]|uniref:sialate O-acetylesterase n=1 Tax=Neobacillus vireti TaxID=220686 RepID=UPI002FFE3B60
MLNKKHAIVLVAGQSNAVGYDESPVEYRSSYSPNKRIKQLGFNGTNNLKIVDLTHCAESYQDMTPFTNPANPTRVGTKGIHLPLANELLKHIPSDYELLIISCAFGGTGFTAGVEGTYDAAAMKPMNGTGHGGIKWSQTSPYYLAMRDRLKFAFDLSHENVFLGTVWIQGEQDHADPSTHYTEFQNMTTAFFHFFNTNGYSKRVKKGTFDKDIWYNVETTGYWYTTFAGCETIWNNYRTWNPTTYVLVARETETNLVNGTGATSSTKAAHFGNNAYEKVIAPNIVKTMKTIGTVLLAFL